MNEPASFALPARLEAAVLEFIESTERGEQPDREGLLSHYSDVASELAEFFADHDRMAALAGPQRTAEMRLAQTAMFAGGAPGSSDTTWRSASGAAVPAAWQIGQYEILEEIGRGGMGVVYRARHRGLNRIVALKTILAGRLASADDRSRFAAESLAAAKLSHPGIVPIFEVGDAAGQPYFAMPLVAGQSLAERLRSGPLPPLVAARLLSKIAAAVVYAHAQGVIHRDLKPGNILLEGMEAGEQKSEVGSQLTGNAAAASSDVGSATFDLTPRITDFGLAKCLGDADELTATGQILGTPSYMPPEQAAGRRHEVGPAADIYALGAILYAALTGRAPFVSDNPVEVILHVLEREPPLPSSLAAGVPRELEWICLKCLEKKPANRYASAAELADDLDRFLRHEPPLAHRPTAMQRLRRWVRRKPVLAAHLLGLAAPLTAGQFVFALHPDRNVAYHLRICGMLLVWMAASIVCQWLMERRRTSQWPLYVWAAADALLLTMTLGLMVSPLGVFVGGYAALIVVSSLAGRTRLVAFTTASSMLAYGALLVLRPEEAQPLHYAIFAQMTLALCGVAASYQVWRMSVLREYYGERPAA